MGADAHHDNRIETPDVVYGRLLETVHINGYTAARACSELDWLLADNRWKQCGGGFDDFGKFLSAIDISKFRLAAEDRKALAKKLHAFEASQRAIGQALGASQSQIQRDLADDPKGSNPRGKLKQIADSTGSSDPHGSPAPFQLDGAAVATAAEKKIETAQKRQTKEAKREEKRDDNRKKIATIVNPIDLVGTVRFPTIMLDPPWDWGDEGDFDQLGRARPTYKTMSFEELLLLPVPTLADANCHLYLWITNRSLPKGFDLIERWGFRYITCLTWSKPSYGMGNYFRGQTEHMLFGVKGSQGLKRKDVGTVFNWPRGPKGHSSKPVEAYEMVESCSPGPYLEMFSRCERPDWTMWGEESHVAAA